MALSIKDIQIIKEIVKEVMTESISELRNEIKVDMKILKSDITRELREEFSQGINSLKIYMDVEFRKIDHGFDRLEETIRGHDDQINELRN